MAVIVGVCVAAVVGAWVWWTAAGSGVGWLLLAVGVLMVSPLLWQLGMVPFAYSISSRTVAVHRRWLPDSRFPVVGPAERYDPASAASADPPSMVERMTADTLLTGPRRELSGRNERVFKAVTNIEQAVRVRVPRGSLLVSPEDPDAFLRASWEA
jgi:hypothetical protein